MKVRNRLYSVLLIMVMFISMFQLSSFATADGNIGKSTTTFSDMPNNWSTTALNNAIGNGLLTGFEGKIMPEDNLTRAEIAAIMVRAFGATVKGDLSNFTDVKSTDWFADYMAKAYQMGVMSGNKNKMNPNSEISRQEVFVILSRAFKLKPESVVKGSFVDLNDVSAWAKGDVNAFINNGYVQGSNGKLNPQASITRAEFAQVLDNILKQHIRTAGIVTTVVDGNIMINTQNVTLKGVTVKGDLIIGDGVGNGEVLLDNVNVTGRLVIRGGGVNSIIIKGSSNVSNIIVARIDGAVSVKVKDDAHVEIIVIDDGSDDVNIEGIVGNVDIEASDIKVNAVGAKINTINIIGGTSSINIDANSSVERLDIHGEADNARVEVAGKVTLVTTLATKSEITGSGSVTKVEALAGSDNTKIETPKTQIVVEVGVTGVTGGGGTAIGAGTTSSNAEVKVIIPIVTPEPAPTTTQPPTSPTIIGVSTIAVLSAGDVTTLTNGGTLQMSSVVMPEDATNKAIVWSVQTLLEGTATIDSTTGLLTATGAGTVRVTATNTNSGITGSKDISILPIITEVDVDNLNTLMASLANVNLTTINVNGDITIPEDTAVTVLTGQTLVLNNQLTVLGNIEVKGSIITPSTTSAAVYATKSVSMPKRASARKSGSMTSTLRLGSLESVASIEESNNNGSKLKILGNGKINVKDGSSMMFNSLSDILTSTDKSVLLYAGSKVKVGDKQYVGDAHSSGLIKLTNFEGSNRPVAGYFFNGDGDLLLVIFEKAEILGNKEDLLDISLLIKAGTVDSRAGELEISDFNVLRTSGRIAIESNGNLIVNDKSVVSANNPDSVFNATGGDLDNRRGILFSRSNSGLLNVSIRGNVIMNTAMSSALIRPEYFSYMEYYHSDLAPRLDIRFNPVEGDFVSGPWPNPITLGKYKMVDLCWVKDSDISTAVGDRVYTTIESLPGGVPLNSLSVAIDQENLYLKVDYTSSVDANVVGMTLDGVNEVLTGNNIIHVGQNVFVFRIEKSKLFASSTNIYLAIGDVNATQISNTMLQDFVTNLAFSQTTHAIFSNNHLVYSNLDNVFSDITSEGYSLNSVTTSVVSDQLYIRVAYVSPKTDYFAIFLAGDAPGLKEVYSQGTKQGENVALLRFTKSELETYTADLIINIGSRNFIQLNRQSLLSLFTE